MITLTPAAAKQARIAAQQGQMEGLPLRLAVKRDEQGNFHYGMGFDDQQHEADVKFTSEGIEIVVAPHSAELLKDAVLDYVELEPGQFQFVFMNPNDPNYTPPQSSETH